MYKLVQYHSIKDLHCFVLDKVVIYEVILPQGLAAVE
jgi:hypothetical protein